MLVLGRKIQRIGCVCTGELLLKIVENAIVKKNYSWNNIFLHQNKPAFYIHLWNVWSALISVHTCVGDLFYPHIYSYMCMHDMYMFICSWAYPKSSALTWFTSRMPSEKHPHYHLTLTRAQTSWPWPRQADRLHKPSHQCSTEVRGTWPATCGHGFSWQGRSGGASASSVE